ncbi:MAG: type II secretion system F family protein [Candidatus Omnitrophota bacterium]|nr:type II secretion system F family protein [Candidatus Omnitrophota bacterium]
MEPIIFAALLFGISVYFILYYFKAGIFGIDQTHLPDNIFTDSHPQMMQDDTYVNRSQRSFLVLSGKFKHWERRFPLPTAGIRSRLIKAGSPMGVLEFLAFKLLFLAGAPILGLVFLSSQFPREMVLIVSLFIGFFLPEMWLKNKIKARQTRIRRDLPNIIDLLNLCVSGGLDFMLAVNRVVKDLKPCDLTRELSEVYRETQVGKTRRESLKNFAGRVDLPEVHSFVRTLVQADRMGTPLAEALSLQSEEMRMRRFQNGESMALKAPIKLLFPLFMFILPVVLIIVGAPIMLQFLRGGINFGM